MDSLTQIVLGSTVAALAVPPAQRKRALIAGALLGTLPDLDTVPLLFLSDTDAVARMTEHRGASHSLLVLPFVGLFIWWLLRKSWQPVREASQRWFWAIQLALLTHPILDAFTVYGTQLLWPHPMSPVMWSSIWIVDLAYTLPLLTGCIVAWRAGAAPRGRRWLAAGLIVSSAYMTWSLVAKTLVERAAADSLAALGLADAAHFSVPLPLTTLLWRVVVMVPDGYWIGDRSLVADRGPMRFVHYPSATAALALAGDVPVVQQLAWFNHGFMRAEVVDGELIISDLRMGMEPDYNFNFAVARQRGDGGWQPILPRQLRSAYRAPVAGEGLAHALQRLWHRVWVQGDDAVLEL